VHEVNTLDLLRIKYGACYLLDRGYLGFHRLLVIHQADAFLSPAPSPIQSSSAAIPVPQTEPAQASCATKPACCLFSLPTRTIQRRSGAWWSRTSGKRVTSLTNNFALKPELIAEFCRQRWQVELFFKWIKQHLRIKTFFGTTEDAVKAQIWIAVCTCVLIAIAKKRLHLPNSLHEILSSAMFETTQINQLLTPPTPDTDSEFEPQQFSLL
jgi:IS4 transposase